MVLMVLGQKTQALMQAMKWRIVRWQHQGIGRQRLQKLIMGLEPLLDLQMRLGEGTGAVLAISIVEAACKTLDEMATFSEAGVSDKED